MAFQALHHYYHYYHTCDSDHVHGVTLIGNPSSKHGFMLGGTWLRIATCGSSGSAENNASSTPDSGVLVT